MKRVSDEDDGEGGDSDGKERVKMIWDRNVMTLMNIKVWLGNFEDIKLKRKLEIF